MSTMTTTMTGVPPTTFTIEPRGAFSLEEAAMFGFGQRHEDRFDGTMRLAFCVDGFDAQAGVELTQDVDGTVHGRIHGAAASTDAVVAQVARVLSLDHDARGYEALGDDDPVLARLLAAAPGLRPPLFHSPYEAAFWCVISMRRPARTANAWRARLAAAAGASFELAGEVRHAVPTPDRILELGPDGCRAIAGFDEVRAGRLVAVAEAASRGVLDVDVLAAADLDDARRSLRTIPGIGAFSADLILIRATGLTDVLVRDEPHVLAAVGHAYGFGRPATQRELDLRADAWRPWRTWVTVLCRAAGPRLDA